MDCNSWNLNDSRISYTLDAFLAPGISPVSWLDLSFNTFTEVPKQLAQFTRLNYIRLDGNDINLVKSQSFQFSTTLKQLNLFRNQLSTIEPNAFPGLHAYPSLFNLNNNTNYFWNIHLGIYGRGSLVDLRLNRLSRFESNVFLPILQQMAPYPGTVVDQTYISINLSKWQNLFLMKWITNNQNFNE